MKLVSSISIIFRVGMICFSQSKGSTMDSSVAITRADPGFCGGVGHNKLLR